MDLFKGIKEFKQLDRKRKNSFHLLFGNILINFKFLLRIAISILGIDLELNIIFNLIMTLSGLVIVFYTWKYIFPSISNFKFYREYIKRNKIWVHEFNEETSLFKWVILNKLYINESENESDSLVINIKEVIEGHNVYSKESILYTIGIYQSGITLDANYDSLLSRYIENRTKKTLTYTNEENIYLINLREKNINDLLNS